MVREEGERFVITQTTGQTRVGVMSSLRLDTSEGEQKPDDSKLVLKS